MCRKPIEVSHVPHIATRAAPDSGQTTTEWLMIAGLLTAVAIAVFDYRHPWSMTGALIYVGKAMFVSLRTMAP